MKMVPIDQLLLPLELNGTDGSNRAIRNGCQIDADNDLEAIRTWLAEYEDSPQTFRSYRKEAERLLLWAMIVRQKPLSSLNRDDYLTYEKFLADPQPSVNWCGPRAQRNSLNWRPFQGPLKPQSQHQAIVIIQSLLSYLVDAGYLAANPLALRRRKRKHLAKQNQSEVVVQRYLEQDIWQFLIKFINNMDQLSPRSKAIFERTRYLFSVLYLLGPRVSEVANSTMGSFIEIRGRWWWKVTGKGNNTAKIPVNEDMLNALVLYREHLGLPPRPTPYDDSPMILSLKGTSGLTDNMIYRIVKDTVQKAAKEFEKQDPIKADKLRSASTHWFRHTAVTHQLDAGIPMRFVSKSARHGKLETTAIYVHEEDDVWHDVIMNHKI